MKKLFVFGALLLTSCAQQRELSHYDYCLTEQAQQAIADGSISAGPIRSTVKQMVNACIPAEEQTPDLNNRAKNILIQLLQDEV